MSSVKTANRNQRTLTKHVLVRDAIFDMFHPATVDQIKELMHTHKIRIGKSSILRVIRRLVRRGSITTFLEREPPQYMRLRENARCKDVRRVA